MFELLPVSQGRLLIAVNVKDDSIQRKNTNPA
jgi:hypothetical protein